VLSSEILEEQFGPTGVEVLYQDSKVRVICTRVLSSGQVLELSWVSFNRKGVKAFADVHEIVGAGESMGKAFKAAGVAFVRKTQSVSQSTLPAIFGELFESTAPATVVQVAIMVGDNKLPYASILETYSPAVKWPQPYARPPEAQSKRLEQFADLLRRISGDVILSTKTDHL
jgi:hypothetical protein